MWHYIYLVHRTFPQNAWFFSSEMTMTIIRLQEEKCVEHLKQGERRQDYTY